VKAQIKINDTFNGSQVAFRFDKLNYLEMTVRATVGNNRREMIPYCNSAAKDSRLWQI
jgi:hypothetical protein